MRQKAEGRRPKQKAETAKTSLLLLAAMLLHLGSMYLAERVRQKPSISLADIFLIPLPLLIIPAIVAVFNPSAAATVLLALLFAGSSVNVVMRARWVGHERQHGERGKLDAARQFLEQQLSSPSPILPEAWLPYVFAFELEGKLDRLPEIEPFRASGGIVAWNRLADRFLASFVTRGD